MNDAFPVKRSERAEHGEANLDAFTRAQPASPERHAQRFPFQQLHGEKQAFAVLVNLVQLAHVRMVDARRCARLSPQALPLLTIAEARADPLDRDRPVQAVIVRRIDDAHASFAQLALDPIAARHLDMRPSSFARYARSDLRIMAVFRRRSRPARSVFLFLRHAPSSTLSDRCEAAGTVLLR